MLAVMWDMWADTLNEKLIIKFKRFFRHLVHNKVFENAPGYGSVNIWRFVI